MRVKSIIYTTLIFSLLLLSSCSGGGSSGTGGYSVKGKIVTKDGKPVVGAAITVLDNNKVPQATGNTNINGTYNFEGLAFNEGEIFCDIPDSEFDEEIFFDFPDDSIILEIITTEQDDGDYDSNTDYDEDLIIIEEEFFDDDFFDEDEDELADDELIDEDIEDDDFVDDDDSFFDDDE